MFSKSLKSISFSAVLLSLLFVSISSVSAHVVVQPSTVNVAQRLNFVVGVPTEKDVPTTSVRLVLPEDLESVRPLVKPGWRVEIKKNEEGKPIEIIWSGGQIPADMKDEFVVSAKAPSTEAELHWKAYQTYSDGSVVSWELSPDVEEREGFGPYSTTKVIDDLDSAPQTVHVPQSSGNAATGIALVALVLASYACFFRNKR